MNDKVLTQIAEYSQTAQALAALRARLSGVVYDVKTTAGMTAAKQDRAEVRGLRTALEAKRVEIKAPALERCRLIDAEAKRITAELLAIEDPIDAQIKAEEARKEAEKAAKAEAERQRVAGIQAKIGAIRETLAKVAGRSSIVIATAAESVAATEIGVDNFQEFAAEAEAVKQATLAKLREMQSAAEAQEEEARKIAAERAELARLRAEEEARKAEEKRKAEEEAARVRAAQEAEAQRLAAERAEFERQQAEARERQEAEQRRVEAERAEQARKDSEARAAEERKAAAERAEADRIAREAREAEERRLAAERAELDRQRAEIAAREQAERDRVAAEEEARQRREFLASLQPPSALDVAELVASHYAADDLEKAAGWLAAIDFGAFADSLKAAA